LGSTLPLRVSRWRGVGALEGLLYPEGAIADDDVERAALGDTAAPNPPYALCRAPSPHRLQRHGALGGGGSVRGRLRHSALKLTARRDPRVVIRLQTVRHPTATCPSLPDLEPRELHSSSRGPSRHAGGVAHFCVNARQMLSARSAIAVPFSALWRRYSTQRRQKSSQPSRQARSATSG